MCKEKVWEGFQEMFGRGCFFAHPAGILLQKEEIIYKPVSVSVFTPIFI